MHINIGTYTPVYGNVRAQYYKQVNRDSPERLTDKLTNKRRI